MFASHSVRLFASVLILAWQAALLPAQAPHQAEVSSEQDISKVEAKSHAPSDGHGEEAHSDDAHGGAHDHAHIGEGSNKQPHEIRTDLAFFTLVVFLLLLLILSKFAWGPIVAGLEKREHHIAEQIAAAERTNRESQRLLAEYDKKLASAQDDVRAIIDEARRDAEYTQQEILAKARAEAQSEKERSLREIEMATAASLKQLAEESANLAVDLAGRIVQARLSPAEHQQLITEALVKFGQATPSNN